MLRKSLLAVCLGVVIGVCSWWGNSTVSYGEESGAVQETYYEVGVFQETDEVAVLSAGEAWQDTIQQRILEAAKNFQYFVDLSDLQIPATEANQDIVGGLYVKTRREHPELFYLGGGYALGCGDYISYLSLGFDNEVYDFFTGEIDMTKINLYNAALNRAMSVVKEGMTDVEKALALHDYLALNCKYGGLRGASSGYDALVNHEGVCADYALAYLELLTTAGIPCYMVESSAMDHAWNMIYVDGAWYHVDVTFDDAGGGYLSHTYFLMSDAEAMELGYRDWGKTYSYYELPAASTSGAFSDCLFRKAEYTAGFTGEEPVSGLSFSYHDGYWYYLTWQDGVKGYIARSKMDGSQKSVWKEEGTFNSLQVIDGRLFYSDNVRMYTATLAPDLEPECMLNVLGNKSLYDYAITGFELHSDATIEVFLYRMRDYDNQSVIINATTRETSALPKLVMLQSPTINYTTYGHTKTDGEFGLKYSDGSIVAIDSDDLGDYSIYIWQEGVYDIEVEYKGLTTTYQISLQKDFPIADVLASENNWKYPGIKYVYDNGYMSGVDAEHFAPDSQLTRAMLVQILYNMEGAPEIEYAQQFDDVTSDKWYAKAVTWAYENQIASGYEGGSFGAEDNITREQAAVMLKKYAERKGFDTTGRAELSGFGDADQIHGWAEEAISWANYSNIITGKPGPVLDPCGNATRAEMATMIMKFCKA